MCLVAELDYSQTDFWSARKDVIGKLKNGVVAIWVISVKDGKRSLVFAEVVGNKKY